MKQKKLHAKKEKEERKKGGNHMKLIDTDFFKGYVHMAMDGDRMGWHERNGGNFTYWMTHEEAEAVREDFSEGEWREIGTSVKGLANEYFLISGTGEYFHNMEKDPEGTIGVIQLDERGEQYRVLWGLKNGGRPTSELPTHLMNMEVCAKRTKNENRVIYHCHCPNIIALTFILPNDSSVVTSELWQSMTECPVIFPEGVGIVEWMVPGGREIAVASSRLMESYNAVIWAHHGIFCSEKNFDLTFGLMHTIEKSAEIWLKVHSVVDKPRQTIRHDDFVKLAKEFGVELNEAALEKTPR